MPTTSIEEMAMYMHNYFPTEVWGDFNFIVDERIDENSDPFGDVSVSYGPREAEAFEAFRREAEREGDWDRLYPDHGQSY